MNGQFAIFYIKNEQYYPVALTSEENTLIQMMIGGALKNKVTIIDKPFGRVTNYAEKKPTAATEG